MATQRKSPEERTTTLGLVGVFWGILGIVALLRGNRVQTTTSALDFVMLGFATLRMGRLIAFDRIAEPLRAPFTKTVPDDSGAGDTVVAKGRGPREVIGELISCPICVGTWVAAGLVYGLNFFPAPTRLVISIMSAIGLAEMLHEATEALTWSGQVERNKAGNMSRTSDQT